MIAATVRRMWEPVSEWLNRETKIKYVIPAYLILALGAIFGLTRLDNLNEARIQDQAAAAAISEYNQCVTRVETRASIRAILLAIVAQFPESESADAIETLINNEYPALDQSATCDPLLEPVQVAAS